MLILSRGFPKEQAFKGSAGISGPKKLNPLGMAGEVVDALEELRGGIPEDNFGLVLDGNEILKTPFLHQRALVDDADPVTHFLDLLEKMRAKEDGKSPVLQLENEVPNLP